MDDAGAIITLHAGAYRLRERLAVSAYGVLWRADGPPSTGEVAIKLVNRLQMEQAGPALHAHWRDSAANEIAFLCSLAPWDQRHIVRLLDSGTHEGLPAMALELHAGDLARHVAEERKLGRRIAFPRVIDWLEQANQALARVHQYGFRHLDLKPANLLLDGQGRLKLADFGTIRQLADREAHAYTGTARWQAPEQFCPAPGGGYVTDARTDYFALGTLFHYLVSGELLEFSNECASAGSAGAGKMMKRPMHCLLPREANRFLVQVEQQAPGAGQPAIALLRALLCPEREGRPRHSLEISRALASIRGAYARVQAMRQAA